MNTSETNIKAKDPLDILIYGKGLRIQSIYFNSELDMMLVILNNKKIIRHSISDFKQLKDTDISKLMNYETDGIGVHWPDLDEDLSLRGFLVNELMTA